MSMKNYELTLNGPGNCDSSSVKHVGCLPFAIGRNKGGHQRGLSLDFRSNILSTSDTGQFLIPAAWPMNHSPISSGCSYLAQPHFVLIIRIRIAGGRELIFLEHYVPTAHAHTSAATCVAATRK